MCDECIVADEYTQHRHMMAIVAYIEEELRKDRYFADGGTVTKIPPFTSGGMKPYASDERPETSLIANENGFRVKL